MNLKEHVLAALEEQINLWEELITNMNDEQASVVLIPSYWSIKDNIAHLMAWQQRSTARLEAASFDREPVFPGWPPDVDSEEEDKTEEINDWIFEKYRDQAWTKVHQGWKEGYQRLLEFAKGFPERDLLDAGKYAWLKGHPLAEVLLSTYDHHQEHLEKLLAWLEEHRKRDIQFQTW